MLYVLVLVLTVHKRIKDIGSISKRQFQRRIKNQLQLLHNNNLAIPINPDIQSSSQVCFKIKVFFK